MRRQPQLSGQKSVIQAFKYKDDSSNGQLVKNSDNNQSKHLRSDLNPSDTFERSHTN